MDGANDKSVYAGDNGDDGDDGDDGESPAWPGLKEIQCGAYTLSAQNPTAPSIKKKYTETSVKYSAYFDKYIN